VKPGIYDTRRMGECYIVRPDGSAAFYNRWADKPRWAGISARFVPADAYFEINLRCLKALPKDVPPSPFKADKLIGRRVST
jgi:hypothetical protein